MDNLEYYLKYKNNQEVLDLLKEIEEQEIYIESLEETEREKADIEDSVDSLAEEFEEVQSILTCVSEYCEENLKDEKITDDNKSILTDILDIIGDYRE